MHPLGHRNYRLFVVGQLVSLVGTWTQTYAQDWLVYRLTSSPFWLGVVSLCQQLPVFLLATVGGVIADRYPRRSVLLLTQSLAMVLAFVLAALAFAGRVQIAHVLVLGALLGVTKAVDIPTRQSFVSDLVGRDDLAGAVAINGSMVTGAAFLGPAIAGVAIQALGEGWCFLVNGASFAAVIAGLAAMRDLPAPAGGRVRESVRTRVLEGFRFAAREPNVRALLVLLAWNALVAIPSATLMPVVAKQTLHGDARTYGWLGGALGGGALLSALVIAARKGLERTNRFIAFACALLGLLTACLGVAPTFATTLIVAALLGAATMSQMTLTNARIQTLTPDALRGRVMAIWAMIFMGVMPFGSMAVGALATALGPRTTLLGEGALCLVGALAFTAWARAESARAEIRAATPEGAPEARR